MFWFEIVLLCGLFASTFLVQIRLPILALSANNLAVPLFALALAWPRRALIPQMLRAHRTLLGTISLLYLWLWVAAFDSLLPAVSIRYAAKCLGYLLLLGAFLLWLHGRPATRRAALRAVYGIGIAIAAFGMLEFWFPHFGFITLRGDLVSYPRVSSLFIGPNEFAVLMAITVALGAILRHDGEIRPLLFRAPLVILLIVLALSGSRDGWFVFCALLVLLAGVRVITRRELAVIMALFALAVLSFPISRGRVGFSEPPPGARAPGADPVLRQITTPRGALIPRMRLWHAALELIRQNPITGIGPEAFSNTAGVEILRRPGFNTHSLLLNVAVELGLVGLALLAVCLGVLFRSGHPREWMTSVPLLGLGLGQIFDCFTYDYAFMTFSLFFIASYVSAPRDVD